MENSPLPMPAQDVIDREFLEIRAKILELAASFDRIDRGAGDADPEQLELIHQGLDVLKQSDPDRAEKIQLLFSREYKQDWRSEFGI